MVDIVMSSFCWWRNWGTDRHVIFLPSSIQAQSQPISEVSSFFSDAGSLQVEMLETHCLLQVGFKENLHAKG